MRGASRGRGDGGEPHRRMQVLGPESQSRGCQPGSGSVPRAPWFPLTDVPTAPREGGKGTQEGRCLAPLTPKPQWPEAQWPPGRDPAMGPPGARLANSPIYPRRAPPAAGIDPLASPLTPGRLRLWFAHLMPRADSLEKTLMVGKIKGRPCPWDSPGKNTGVPFSPPDRDRRGDSPAWSGRGSRPSRRPSGRARASSCQEVGTTWFFSS